MISARLQAIASLVTDDYSHVWDCCCDHGYLGIELIQQTNSIVHFVDRETHLLSTLEQVLVHGAYSTRRWELHCQDVEQLKLPAEKRQLVIIAGVGGLSCLAMVESLLAQHPQHELDFLLCPVRQIEELRSALSAQPLGLLRDVWLQERARNYEILHLRQHDQNSITPVGKYFWCFQNTHQFRYIQQRIDYLNYPANRDKPFTHTALQSYRALLTRFSFV